MSKVKQTEIPTKRVREPLSTLTATFAGRLGNYMSTASCPMNPSAEDFGRVVAEAVRKAWVADENLKGCFVVIQLG